MYKKTKEATVSDFRSQLGGLQDSPFTRETTSSVELDLRCRDKLVIDFGKDNRYNMRDNHFGNGDRLKKLGLPLRGQQSENQQSVAIYAFDEHAHVYFCDPASSSYHYKEELAIFNNRVSISLVRFDFDNQIHHFRNIKKLYHKSSDLYTSCGFFQRRFHNLMISTTLNSKVVIDDFETGKIFSESRYKDATYAVAWDELYGVFDIFGRLSLFDIRDPISPVRVINCQSDQDLRPSHCFGAERRDNRLLVNTNRETCLFDIRMSDKDIQYRSSMFNGKRNSLTYLEDKLTEVPQQNSQFNCAKGFFVDDGQAIVMDFVERTLDLHQFCDNSIQKSLFFGRKVFDISYNERLRQAAVLLENQEGSKEVAIFNSDLSLFNVFSLDKSNYQKLGFIGTEGKLLIHSRNDYVVFNIDQGMRLENF